MQSIQQRSMRALFLSYVRTDFPHSFLGTAILMQYDFLGTYSIDARGLCSFRSTVRVKAVQLSKAGN